MAVSEIWRTRLKRTFYVFIGLLTVSVLGLSFVQLWVVYTAGDIKAYGATETTAQGWPPEDKRGAFLMLNKPHSANFAGELVELLATTEPGVVDTNAGAHLTPAELQSVLIQSAALGEAADYRVYRIGEADDQPMKAERQPGGKVMLIRPANGTWLPGNYLVDIPSEGMFGGRTYYQFYIDPPT